MKGYTGLILGNRSLMSTLLSEIALYLTSLVGVRVRRATGNRKWTNRAFPLPFAAQRSPLAARRTSARTVSFSFVPFKLYYLSDNLYLSELL